MATDTAAGRQRLRHVAKLCEAHGQRVQKSVFECIVTPGQLEQLKHRLHREIDEGEDSLRIYRLQEPRERYLHAMGRKLSLDLHDPLVL